MVQPDEISSCGQSLKGHPRRFSPMNPWSGGRGSGTPQSQLQVQQGRDITWASSFKVCFHGRYATYSLLSMWLVSKDIRGVLLNVNLQSLKPVMLPALCMTPPPLNRWSHLSRTLPIHPNHLVGHWVPAANQNEEQVHGLALPLLCVCLSPGRFSVYWKRKIGQRASSWLCVILNRYYGGRGRRVFSQSCTETQYFLLNMHRKFKKKNTMLQDCLWLWLETAEQSQMLSCFCKEINTCWRWNKNMWRSLRANIKRSLL